MNIKKTRIIIAALSIFSTTTLTSAYATGDTKPNFKPTTEQLLVAAETQAAEDLILADETQKANDEAKSIFSNFLKSENIQLSIDEQKIINDKIKTNSEVHRKNALDRIKEYKLKNGWVEVPQYNQEDNSKGKNDVSALSNSSQLSLSDELFFNASTNQYQFSGNFNWVDIAGWDYLGDTYDITTTRSLNPINVISSYARTYKVVGTYNGTTQTGYSETESGYDSNGVPTSGSKVSKRFENTNGVTWNLQDSGLHNNPYGTSYHSYSYDTDNGRTTTYFTKQAGSTDNKIFIDFEHNYKTYSWSGSAMLSGVYLSGSSLTVNYSSVNSAYQRTSTGKTF